MLEDYQKIELTPGEKFWLYKRRRGFSVASLARQYNVAFKTITNWTKDRQAPVPYIKLDKPIDKGEFCALMRRRAKMSIKEVAPEMGISHVTLIKREFGKGDLDETFIWWTKHRIGRDAISDALASNVG